ncbi:hypothetical protein SAMD00023353_0800160 [Rosellinia necatrix]|uniref:Uncharacterized protein n=1 Tax=Rosellinia necatrix TaxID=77044 RepID=A0A1W2TAR9_ROSNE|nr:hypothetical protein SAMD00023353_0800160 [Rosellinia necatrix]
MTHIHTTGEIPNQQCLERLGEPRGEVRRMKVKDLWPTKDNFADSSLVRKPRAISTEHRSSAQPPPPPSLKSIPISSRIEMVQTIPRKRRVSDFENFGSQKRISLIHHDKDLSISATKLPQEYGYQTGDDDEVDVLHGLVTEESRHQSVVTEECEYIPATLYGGEENDSGSSQELGWDGSNDQDKRIQNTISDSQPDEISLNGSDLITAARWISCLLGADVTSE